MRLRYDPAPLAHVVDDFEGDTSERLVGGVRLSAVADPDPDDEPLVYIHAFAVRRRTPKTDPALLCIYNGRAHQPLLWVKAGKYWHAARLETDRKRLLSRSGGCVRAARDKDGFQFYARVYHFRKWVLLLPLAFCALLLCLSLSFCGNPAESGSPALGFLQGMTQTEGAKSDPVLSVEYASYSSTPDSTLQADRLAQHLVLSLPANCKGGGNPIDSAPSIFVDLDHSGTFDPSEIVYNPNGDLLKAGTEVSELEFTQAVPAGTYDALTRWDSVLSSDHSQPAGSATFKWVATFQ